MPSPPPMPGNQQPQYPPRPQQQFAPQQFPPQQYPQQPYPPQYQPQGPGMYPGMQPQQPPKRSAGKTILAVVGGIVALLAVVIVALATLGGGSTAVGTPVITDQVNEDSQAPLRDLKGAVTPKTGVIYAAVEVELKKDQVLAAKWYYANQHQAQLDTEIPVPDDFKGWASFHISNDKDWPVGSYKVEIYVDNKLEQTATFSVK